MGASPWNSREGQYDKPSSAVPSRDVSMKRESAPLPGRRPKASYLDQRVLDAQHQGIRAVSSSTILQRIDDAIERLVAAGHGRARAIYLTDADLVAFREVSAVWEYRDIVVSAGAASKVYSASRVARSIRKAPT